MQSVLKEIMVYILEDSRHENESLLDFNKNKGRNVYKAH